MRPTLCPNTAASVKIAATVLAAVLFAGPAAAQVKVAFLVPEPAGQSPFWARTIAAMQAAADDLGLNLNVAYSKPNTYSNRKDGMAVLGGDDKPDYFLTGFWPGATESLIEYAEQHRIKTLIFNAGAGEPNEAGRPREKFGHWIGQMTPDDEQAGYDLADILIARAGGAGDEAQIGVIGLGGNGDTNVDADRRRGLKRRIDQAPIARLEHFLFAEWSQAVAYQSLLDLIEPGGAGAAPVVWSASDTMAFGAVQAVRERGQTPGDDVFLGAINWSGPGVEAVMDGDLEAVVGGHFLEGAWALVLVHDHYHDYDFADDLGVEFHTQLKPITADNAPAYRDAITNTDWDTIDFKRYSKVHNPDLDRYSWPLDDVMSQLGEQPQ